jgi:Tol biopolymer transport system component
LVGRRGAAVLGPLLAAVLMLSVVPAAAAKSDAGVTRLVSAGAGGVPAAGQSYAPAVSADGRFVAFDSDASNLVPDDRNDRNDVFVRDRKAGVTTRVSTDSASHEADGSSYTPSISGDGRYVAFVSDADNLVPGDTNKATDVFLKDRVTNRTTRLSVALDDRETTGGSAPQISRNGRFVVYSVGTPLRSIGTDEDLAGLFVYDITTDKRERLGHLEGDDPTISADGRWVAFSSEIRDLVPGDTNRKADCFVFDRRTRQVQRVSVGGRRRFPGGWWAGEVQGDGESTGAIISTDARYVAFVSSATNLVPGDTNHRDDVLLRDLLTGATRRLSVSQHGEQGGGVSGGPVLSGDGTVVVFLSQASNLVAEDPGGHGYDVFRLELPSGAITQVNVAPNGAQPDGETSSFPALSDDGRVVVFGTRAPDITGPAAGGHDEIMAREYPKP